ncbi:MAG: MFS transporter, partial [Betaproteobacteria bacterium]|nr:MFS transporter [Betaproteobacteria bacterium]
AGLTGVVAGANNSAALGGIYFATQPESKVGLVGSQVPVSAVARLAVPDMRKRGVPAIEQMSPVDARAAYRDRRFYTQPDPPAVADHPVPTGDGPGPSASDIGFFWVVYFLGATGGLMAIAHAVPIVDALGGAEGLASLAPTLNALGNVMGCIAGGLLVDRMGSRHALVLPIAVLAVSLLTLAFTVDPMVALAGLCACGMAYGALISAIPLVLRLRFGVAQFNKTFGLVFTAWGSAGLLGPVAAGLLFDQTGGYQLGLALAAVAAAAALGLLCLASGFFRSPSPETGVPDSA